MGWWLHNSGNCSSNRLKGCALPKDSDMKKKGRGLTIYKHALCGEVRPQCGKVVQQQSRDSPQYLRCRRTSEKNSPVCQKRKKRGNGVLSIHHQWIQQVYGWGGLVKTHWLPCTGTTWDQKNDIIESFSIFLMSWSSMLGFWTRLIMNQSRQKKKYPSLAWFQAWNSWVFVQTG